MVTNLNQLIMKKRLLLLGISLFISTITFSQFNIGTNVSNDKVVLQIVSGDSTQTMIIPVTNDSDRPAAEASLRGSLVYNTTDSTVQYCTGTQWLELSPSAAGGSNIYDANGTLTGARVVDMDGNNLSFNNGGNVGIGTTTPEDKLHISGSNTSNLVQLQLENTNTGTASSVELELDNWGQKSVIGASTAALNAGQDLYFSTNNASGTLTERVRINEDGEVGIGTNNPQSLLHLDNASGSSKTLTIDGNTDGEVIQIWGADATYNGSVGYEGTHPSASYWLSNNINSDGGKL